MAKEGADSVARAGLAYRFPLPGERTAGDEASKFFQRTRRREADAERRLLEGRKSRTFRSAPLPEEPGGPGGLGRSLSPRDRSAFRPRLTRSTRSAGGAVS